MAHGPTSRDSTDFGPDALTVLARAAVDARWLRDRGYAINETLNLVGNHFRLSARQRQFLFRCVSPPHDARRRRQKHVEPERLRGRDLWIDGYNCLIITECCLAGGVVLLSDDGVLRDVQGLYGAYRESDATHAALECLVDVLVRAAPSRINLCLDRRMRYARSTAGRWPGLLEDAGIAVCVTEADPADDHLVKAPPHAVVATSDREVMDAVSHVTDLPRAVADTVPDITYVDLGQHASGNASTHDA